MNIFKKAAFVALSTFVFTMVSCSSDSSSGSSTDPDSSSSVEISSSSVIEQSSSSEEPPLSSSSEEASSSSVVDVSSSSNLGGGVGTFTDARDEQVYEYVTIGTQVWMAENLNYDTTGSKCYDDSIANCDKYGRLYNWATAKIACPADWHLPSDAEWTTLITYVGDTTTAGTKLKSASGWNISNGVPLGTDDFGFSALPGGDGFSDGAFSLAGSYGYWWSATERNDNSAYYRIMRDSRESVGSSYSNKNGYLYSARCLRD